MVVTTLIASGGVSHDFEDSTASLAELLANSGHAVTIETDLDVVVDCLPRFDFLMFNTLRWSMTNHERFTAMRPTWGYAAGPKLKNGISDFLARGGGIYALHASSICFDDWPEWRSILGATWRWDVSRHDPVGPAAVTFAPEHPITRGLPDFTLVDEIYTRLDLAEDAQPLAFATQGEDPERWPILFAREVMGGRVVYDALGHDRRSIEQPIHAEMIQRGLCWLRGGSATER